MPVAPRATSGLVGKSHFCFIFDDEGRTTRRAGQLEPPRRRRFESGALWGVEAICAVNIDQALATNDGNDYRQNAAFAAAAFTHLLRSQRLFTHLLQKQSHIYFNGRSWNTSRCFLRRLRHNSNDAVPTANVMVGCTLEAGIAHFDGS